MSIQSVRRLLMAANVVSVLLLVLIATAFMHPQSRSRRDRKWPSFTIEWRQAIDLSTLGQTEHACVPLGARPRVSAVAESPTGPDAAPIRLADLGTVLAVVAARSSHSDDLRTSITFRRNSGEVHTLAVGDALETKPHPRFGSYVRVPARYRLVACDPKAPDGAAIHLLFDTDCDGVDLQRMDWDCRADSAAAELRGVVIAASELDHAQD